MDKSEIKKVLEALQLYSYWMYYSAQAQQLMERQTIKEGDREFKLSIAEDGDFLLTEKVLGSKSARFKAVVLTSDVRPEAPLDNLGFHFQLINQDELPTWEIEMYKTLGVYVLSAFQRSIAFQFFSRMHPNTIESLAHDLALAVNRDQSVEN